MKSKTVLIAYKDDLCARSLSTFFHGVGYRVEMVGVLSEMIRRVLKVVTIMSCSLMMRSKG